MTSFKTASDQKNWRSTHFCTRMNVGVRHRRGRETERLGRTTYLFLDVQNRIRDFSIKANKKDGTWSSILSYWNSYNDHLPLFSLFCYCYCIWICTPFEPYKICSLKAIESHVSPFFLLIYVIFIKVPSRCFRIFLKQNFQFLWNISY